MNYMNCYNPKELSEIDLLVAGRIKRQRISLGLSREQLATCTGVTHQQISKYEKGVNRITVGRAYLFARALNIPLYELFKEKDFTTDIDLPDERQRLCIEVARSFLNIKNVHHQLMVSDLARSLAKA